MHIILGKVPSTRRRQGLRLIAWLLPSVFCFGPAQAEHAIVAVATNFNETAQRLVGDFEAGGDHRITLSSGSTGKLYAQILNGAPFDALLAADRERPARLESSKFGVAGTRFSYALGRLTLWSPDPRLVTRDGRMTLQEARFATLAIANPALAPYGAAARQALQSLGVWESIKAKVVMGENVGQAQVLVATGNASLGLLARSHTLRPRLSPSGSHWDVPAELHEPIRQDAVLLSRGIYNPAAVAFLAYLRSEPARTIIRSFGYGRE